MAVSSTKPAGKSNKLSHKSYTKQMRYAQLAKRNKAEHIKVILGASGEWLDQDALHYFDEIITRIAVQQGTNLGSKKKTFLR